MRRVLTLTASELRPPPAAVLAALGVPSRLGVPERMAPTLVEALARLDAAAQPRAVWQRLSGPDFEAVYAGDGANEPDTPLAGIAPRAVALALFVATLGEEVSAEIGSLLQRREVAVAAALDAAASLAAEAAVVRLEGLFGAACAGTADSERRPAVLAYSPGYCGWHTSGQRRLFAALRPEEVGVTLSEGCMMRPLKSVSGVLVAGLPEIHDFEPDFAFCTRCATVDCRLRIDRLRAAPDP